MLRLMAVLGTATNSCRRTLEDDDGVQLSRLIHDDNGGDETHAEDDTC